MYSCIVVIFLRALMTIRPFGILTDLDKLSPQTPVVKSVEICDQANVRNPQGKPVLS